MKEIWKAIKGYEGLYQVSNLGRVKSLYRCIILSPKISNSGYYVVTLSLNGETKMFLIHRLVAQNFLENPDNLSCVNHKDQNKLNNCVSNLEWCDNRYNIRYSKAKKVGCYKDDKLIKIYDALRDTKKDGFNFRSIASCCSGKYKHSGGYQWHYI